MCFHASGQAPEMIICQAFDVIVDNLFCPILKDDSVGEFKLLFDRVIPGLIGYDSKELFCKKYVSDDGLALNAMKRLFQLSISEKQFFQWVAENEPVERNVRASYNQHHPSSSFDMSAPFCKFFVMAQFFPIFTKLTRQFIAKCFCEKRFYALVKKLLMERFSIDRSEEALAQSAVLFGYNSAFNEHAGCSKISSDIDVKCVVCADDPQADEIISAVEQVFELMNHEFSREYGGVTFEGYVFSDHQVQQFYKLDHSAVYLPPHTHLRGDAQLDSLSFFKQRRIRKFHADPSSARLVHDCQCYALSTFPGNVSRILGDERVFDALMRGRDNFRTIDFVELVLRQLLSPWASKRDTPGAAVLASGSDSEHSSPNLSRRNISTDIARRPAPRFGSDSNLSSPKPRGLDDKSYFSGAGSAEVIPPLAASIRGDPCPQSNQFTFNVKALLRLNDAANCVQALAGSVLSFPLKTECHLLSKFAIILRNLKEELACPDSFDCADANLLNSLDFYFIYCNPDLLSQFMLIFVALLNQSFIPEDVADRIRGSLHEDQSYFVFQQAVSVFFRELDARVADIITQIQSAISGMVIPWSFAYAQQVQLPRWERERKEELEQEVPFCWWKTW